MWTFESGTEAENYNRVFSKREAIMVFEYTQSTRRESTAEIFILSKIADLKSLQKSFRLLMTKISCCLIRISLSATEEGKHSENL